MQEPKWKDSKAQSIQAGFKLVYHGVDRKGNGVGVFLKEDVRLGNVTKCIKRWFDAERCQ